MASGTKRLTEIQQNIYPQRRAAMEESMIFQTAEFFVGSRRHAADTPGGRRRQPVYSSHQVRRQASWSKPRILIEQRRGRTGLGRNLCFVTTFHRPGRSTETMNGRHMHLFFSLWPGACLEDIMSQDGQIGENAVLQKSTVVRSRSASLGTLGSSYT